jgi:xylulose-5-phosphate/fructose-6-phosphate phosphoketolase
MSTISDPAVESPASEQTLNANELRLIDAYWRACNYMCAGMLYLRDNALLRQPLGFRSGPEFHLGPPESRHSQI